MADNKNCYVIRPVGRQDPDGNHIRFYEVGEVLVERVHWNTDESFKTEQEAEEWIQKKLAKLS